MLQSPISTVVKDVRHSKELRTEPRVLLIAASLRTIGGQSVMARQLVDDMNQDCIPVEFVPTDPYLPTILKPLEHIKYVRTFLRSASHLASLLWHVPRFDLVHVFSASFMSFLISSAPAILVSRMFGKPVILNYHSGEASEHLRTSGWVTRWILSLPDRIVVPSEYLRRVFAEFGYQAYAIPNCVDTSVFVHRERRSVHPRILVARALEPLYDIRCAILAFQLIQKRYPEAELTILGEGSQRKHLERLVAELNLRRVTFSGRVERAVIPRLFDDHDVLLNTSSIDNMPVSILEGFAAGLPIVTTDAGGIPDMVTDRKTGHLVRVGDYAAAAERVIELIENPEQVRRFSRAGQHESQKYTWREVAPQWRNVYRGVQTPTPGTAVPSRNSRS